MTKIKNRERKEIAVTVNEARNQRGLVFVMHGLGGFKEQDHIQTFADAFNERDFTTVCFDTTNSVGESAGKYEDATVTNYYEDLEDVINWASTQSWYKEPFCLAGHSLGGICTSLYAEKYPEKVLALALISPVVSGKLSFEAHKKYNAKELEDWERTGWLIKESKSKKDLVKKLKWSHMTDRLNYDLIPKAYKLTMSILLIVGENDTSTPPDQVQILFDSILGQKKEIHVIENGPHTFRSLDHLTKIKGLFLSWIDKYL